MPDYQKSKIYKLWSPSKNLVYYGSTVQALSQRLAEHLSRKKKISCVSYLILDCEDYKMELVEEYPCNNKQQLLKKEAEYIKNNECCNKAIPQRTYKEYRVDTAIVFKEKIKHYYKNNADKIKEQQKQYYKDNSDKIKERQKQYDKNNADKINERKKQYRLKKKAEKDLV
jgi:Uri superfamily endonuclease